MNKIIATMLMLAVLSPIAVSAATCGDGTNGTVQCGNGNPELVTNVWGGTNSSVPHLQPGQIGHDAAGIAFPCPAFFTNYCVDTTDTEYYKAGARALAKQLQSAGFSLGQYVYWLTH